MLQICHSAPLPPMIENENLSVLSYITAYLTSPFSVKTTFVGVTVAGRNNSKMAENCDWAFPSDGANLKVVFTDR
jgi:hypothetical protein